MKDKDPLWQAYLQESWGPSPERQRELRELEDRLRAEGHSGKLEQFLTNRDRGRNAYKAKQELEKVFRQNGKHAAQRWLVEVKKSWLSDQDITKSLEFALKKQVDRDRNLRNRKNRTTQRSSVLTTLRDGRHPNCLRTLEPADTWSIYIDETGNDFDSTVEPTENSSRTGRVVAVAVPDGVELADCSRFHASERSFAEVDEVLQRVLDEPVGILGFSILDDSAHHRYWIGHVFHLVRWTLLQLPVPTDGRRNRVRILIEQRDSYGPETDLKVVAQALGSELEALDPQRFFGLSLEMGFMNKNHPMNGYVDVVAFTWGSSDWSNKDRLQKSQLMGHCFIKANERSLHHLFLALTQRGPLAPADWYALCAAAADEQEGSFLQRELDRLGKAIASFPRQWELYLAEVQMRLWSKHYSLTELSSAIAWLQQYADHSQIIPGTLRLQLDSSNLALANHRGQIQSDLAFRCLEWVRMLEDEAPQLVAEALLRMASTMTNNFQFRALEEVVENWLAKPVAVAGLLNYGKLQSTRGQMCAFMGDPSTAVSRFEAAAASFSRLTDPRQATREMHQTGIYEMIARMDATPFGADGGEVGKVLDAVRNLLGNGDSEAISRSLSASDQARRFEHHLWLRAMTRFPKQLTGARMAYLANRDKWKNGSDHPWPLILAYRAWLLKDAGETAAARFQIDAAVAACVRDDHGVTLEWMALVLKTLAQAIGVPLPGYDAMAEAEAEAGLRKLLQYAPWEALAKFTAEASQVGMPPARIWAHLDRCLPFNFH